MTVTHLDGAPHSRPPSINLRVATRAAVRYGRTAALGGAGTPRSRGAWLVVCTDTDIAATARYR